MRTLRAGGVVGIFPEGTRGHGLVETAKPGVGYLALRSGATVIPVACSGTPDMAHRRSRRRPPAVLLLKVPTLPGGSPAGRPGHSTAGGAPPRGKGSGRGGSPRLGWRRRTGGARTNGSGGGGGGGEGGRGERKGGGGPERGEDGGGRARRRRGRPAQRRQVDAGQPDPRPPRGRRPGRPRRHPGPGRLRRASGAAGSPSSTPAAGNRTRAGCRRWCPRRPSGPSRPPTPVLFVVDATVGATETDLTVARCCAEPASRWSSPPTRSTTSAPSRTRRAVVARARRAVPGERPARPGQRRPARRDPGRAAGGAARERRGGRPAPGGAGRPAERRQVQPAQPAHRRGARGRRRGRRHHHRPGRQPGRARRGDLALCRHGGVAAPGQPGQRAWSTTPACAPRPRSRPPRWPSSCSTPASRSPSRTSG